MNKPKIYEALNILERKSQSFVNALEAGLVPNSTDKADANVAIINDLLLGKNVVYLPKGVFFFSQPVVLRDGSGIVGESRRESVMKWTANCDGIQIPISSSDPEHWVDVRLESLTLLGTYDTAASSKGLHIYNQTFIDVGRDETSYAAQVGNLYAFELRSSKISDVRIADFGFGLYTDNFVAVGTFRNLFINTCNGWGIFNKASDCMFSNINVTYCFGGIYDIAEANKWSNIKVYMCCQKVNQDYDPSAVHGALFENARNIMLQNFEVQENYGNGIVFNNCHNIFLSVLADANGFSGNNASGVLFLNGCYNITGSIVADNKNTEKTQRLGLYIDESSHGFSLTYAEHNQKEPLQNAGMHTYAMVHREKTYKAQSLVPSQGVNPVGGGCYLVYDGMFLSASGVFYASTDRAAQTELFTVPNDIGAPSAGQYLAGRVFYVSTTDGEVVPVRLVDSKLIALGKIPGGVDCLLSGTFPVKMWR